MTDDTPPTDTTLPAPPGTAAHDAREDPADSGCSRYNVGLDALAPSAVVDPAAIIRTFAFDACTASLPASTALALRSNPHVRYVEPDYRMRPGATGTRPASGVSVDPRDTDWNATRVGADVAHLHGFLGDGCTVAVLDSGVAPDHPAVPVAGGHAVVESRFREGPAWADDMGHGTHVAGVISANRDADAPTGIAPEATLYAVKVLDATGHGRQSATARGLEAAVERDCDVANLSIGDVYPSALLHDALRYARSNDLLPVVAAGNEGPTRNSVTTPGRSPTALTVAALTRKDRLARFSSRGGQVDIAAPGRDITSTVPGGLGTKRGTSMAAPHVTGGAVVLRGGGRSADVTAASLLRSTAALPLPPTEQGLGLLDIPTALQETGLV